MSMKINEINDEIDWKPIMMKVADNQAYSRMTKSILDRETDIIISGYSDFKRAFVVVINEKT